MSERMESIYFLLMKIKRYIVQTKEGSKRYTNLSSFDELKDAMLVKKLIEQRKGNDNLIIRIKDRQAKKYYT